MTNEIKVAQLHCEEEMKGHLTTPYLVTENKLPNSKFSPVVKFMKIMVVNF